MLRQLISLDGPWRFQLDPTAQLGVDQITSWREIRVPGPWQAQFEDLHMQAGVGWYTRSVEIPQEWAAHDVVLRFGAVDYYTEVWVNDQFVGTHEGGYLPFEFSLSNLLNFGGANTILVRVIDPSKENDIFAPFPFREIPHGKQGWYGPIGGIWQSVALEARSAVSIQQVHVTPLDLTGPVSVAVDLTQAPQDARLALRCTDVAGNEVVAVDIPVDQLHTELTLTIPNPILWELDAPHLYTLDTVLIAAGECVDSQKTAFGIRTFEARDGRLWFNGRVFYLRGALDQDYYPEGIYTPPSIDFLRDQVRLAKAMGLNCLRCHIKIPDPRYLQVADEEGILIWEEIPSWGRLTEASGQRVRDTFTGMIARDWNHPSIVIWTIVNENWGTDLVKSEKDRQWLFETVNWARKLAPTRLIVDNSACPPNFHVQTDIDDYHFYAPMPEGVDTWQKYVSEFARRPDWSFSLYGDSLRTGHEPLLISEFGNWGLPDLGQLADAYGGDPWWYSTGKGWEPDVVWPQESRNRFEAVGLDHVFADWSELAQAAQWAQYRALKHEIEVMRAEPNLSGYVITEWTDLHWECNGLVDMARNPRNFARRMPEFNADTIIIPRMSRLLYWSGEHVKLDVQVAHHGSLRLERARLYWCLDGTPISGAFNLTLQPGDVSEAKTIEFQVPPLLEAFSQPIRFWLEDSQRRVIARNEQPLTLLPADARCAPMPLSVVSADPDTAYWLDSHGYWKQPETHLKIVTHLDDSILAEVEAGQHVLCCMTQPGDLPLGLSVAARKKTPWSGDWASSFAWIRPGISHVSDQPLLDFKWQDILPKHVITGVDADHTLSGLFVGWIHMPAALLAQISVGSGRLTVTTFPMLPLDDSPARTIFMHDLIRLAAKPVAIVETAEYAL